MNIKKFILLSIMLVNLILPQSILSNCCSNGSGVAAGVLGGFGAGALVGGIIANSNRRRDVVYVQEPAITYQKTPSKRGLSKWEAELNDKENELNEKELYLKRKAKQLKQKELEIKHKISNI